MSLLCQPSSPPLTFAPKWCISPYCELTSSLHPHIQLLLFRDKVWLFVESPSAPMHRKASANRDHSSLRIRLLTCRPSINPPAQSTLSHSSLRAGSSSVLYDSFAHRLSEIPYNKHAKKLPDLEGIPCIGDFIFLRPQEVIDVTLVP